jgi:small-conductance mechanosensitive channel
MNVKMAIDYAADNSLAKKCIKEALDQSSDVLSEPSPNIFITEISSEGVVITVNFWIDTDKHRPIVAYDQAVSAMLKHLEEAKIDLFPQREDEDTPTSKGRASSTS